MVSIGDEGGVDGFRAERNALKRLCNTRNCAFAFLVFALLILPIRKNLDPPNWGVDGGGGGGGGGGVTISGSALHSEELLVAVVVLVVVGDAEEKPSTCEQNDIGN